MFGRKEKESREPKEKAKEPLLCAVCRSIPFPSIPNFFHHITAAAVFQEQKSTKTAPPPFSTLCTILSQSLKLILPAPALPPKSAGGRGRNSVFHRQQVTICNLLQFPQYAKKAKKQCKHANALKKQEQKLKNSNKKFQKGVDIWKIDDKIMTVAQENPAATPTAGNREPARGKTDKHPAKDAENSFGKGSQGSWGDSEIAL